MITTASFKLQYFTENDSVSLIFYICLYYEKRKQFKFTNKSPTLNFPKNFLLSIRIPFFRRN